MFDIFRSVKKITGLRKKEQDYIKEPKLAPAQVLESKIDKLSNFFDRFFAYVVVEYRIIKEKLKDLSKTNYNLGIRYLEEGNLKEAIFRFKITKKFWPHNYEAYYELIYCLVLSNEFEEAQKVVDELLKKCPDYKERIDQLFSPQEEAPKEALKEELEVSEESKILELLELKEMKALGELEDLKKIPNKITK